MLPPPPVKGPKSRKVLVTLPAESYAALEALASERGEPVAVTARLAIQAAIEAERKARDEAAEAQPRKGRLSRTKDK